MEKQKAQRQKGPGEHARRGYHHGDLRKAVLEEALGHINRTRDTSFTLRELAARLGVSSTALYRHFDNKLALLAAVAEEGFKELLRRFLSDDPLKDSDALAFMAARGMAYVQFAVSYPAHFRVMFLPELRQPRQFAALSELRQQLYAQLEVALALLKERDLLSDADLREIALTSWATVHGLATLLVDGHVRLESGSGEEVQGLIRRVLAVQAEGFLKDGLHLTQQDKPVARGSAKKSRRPSR